MARTTGREVSPRRSWKLRTRLAAGLAVLFVAIFALIAYSHFQYLGDRRDARLEDMQRVSQTVAASFDGLIYDFESFSLSTTITLGDARIPVNDTVPEQARTSVNNYLKHLHESHGLIRAIFITDPAGKMIFSNESDGASVDISQRDYIKALQDGQTKFWSGGFPGVLTGRMVISHSRVIVTPEGETTGFLVILVDAAALAARLPQGLTSEGHVSIVDANDTVILHVPEEAEVPLGTKLPGWSHLDTARAGNALIVENEAIPVAPDDRYGALIPLETLGWVVSYTLPSSDVEGSTTGLFVRDTLLLGAITLAAFVAMLVFADRTVRPLGRLSEVAGAITRGEDPAGPVSVESGNAEVAQLAETMTLMQAAIREREALLTSQNNALNALEHVGESLAAELDLERSIEAIIEAGVELVGAQAVQLLYREQGGRQRVAITGSRPALALPEDHPVVREALAGKLVNLPDLRTVAPSRGPDAPAARSVLAIPIRSRAGEMEGAVLLMHDDAEVFTAQHERLAMGLARWASIALENAGLYARSQDLVDQLARSNAAKDDFLGIVSHELRTPITTIYGGTLLLRLRRASLPEQAFEDMIVSIAEEAERLHHLVEDLLAIARTELVKELRPVEVIEGLQTVIYDFGTTHKRAVKLTVSPDIPHVMADSTYFRQVVTNLISNADKYTPPDMPLEIDAKLDAGEVAIRIMDNGAGIPEEELPQIFESFYRARGASEMASGSGLGLTVCKRLIEALGGRIWAQNRPEGGLEVGFTLKAVEAPAPVVASRAQDSEEPPGPTSDVPPPTNGHTPKPMPPLL